MPESQYMLSELPVTLVTGYLGSGKTTFINQRLLNAKGLRYAVLVNDFGELNIDAELIATATDKTISLTNGCVCCSIADDMDAAMEQVQQLGHEIDWVLFEASGVADPERIRTRIEARPGFTLEEFLTLIDVTRIKSLVNDKFVGQHIRRQLQLSHRKNESQSNSHLIEFGTRLTKSDLISETELSDIKTWVMTFNNDRDQTSISTGLPNFFTSTVESDNPVARGELESWLSTLSSNLVRIKGFICLTENNKGKEQLRYLLQWVSGNWSLEPWQQPDSKNIPINYKTQLVLISCQPIDHPEIFNH